MKKFTKALAVAGVTIWGFGLGLWAFGPEADSGAVPNDYPGTTVAELRQMPRQKVQIDGQTYRQAVELQDGGSYTQNELEQAQRQIKRGCSVYEDLSVDCSAGSYENTNGVSVREHAAQKAAQAVNNVTA
nr:MAG TPA: hypothetical protein [Caudoviricetes sp.]